MGEIRLQVARTDIRTLIADIILPFRPAGRLQEHCIPVLVPPIGDIGLHRYRHIDENHQQPALQRRQVHPRGRQHPRDRHADGGRAGQLCKYRLVIADTGIGMSREYLPHLFEPYSREMRFGERQAVGTGLGMPITQSIVTQMNGEIHVESAPGEGTTFTIILPFAIAHKQAQAAEAADGGEEAFSLEGRRILLAEDNDLNLEIAEFLLTNAVCARPPPATGRRR